MVNSEELIGTVDCPTVDEVSYKRISLQQCGLHTCTYTPLRTQPHTHAQAYRHTRFGLEKECRCKFLSSLTISAKYLNFNGMKFEVQQSEQEISDLPIQPPGILHSFSSLFYDRSKASSKASSPHSAIQSFLFQMRVSSPFLNTLRTGSFKWFKRPLPGFLTILTL